MKRYFRYKHKLDNSWRVGTIYVLNPDGTMKFYNGGLCTENIARSCLDKGYFDEVSEWEYNIQEGIETHYEIY